MSRQVSMGRIAYADALARQAVGGPAAAAAFEELVFQPLQDELLASTWLSERHQCQGLPTHNQYYIEMGEVVAMMLAEVRWGLRMGWANVTVAPLSTTTFTVSLFGLSVAYDATNPTVVLTATWPQSGSRQVVVGGLSAGGYVVSTAGGPPFTPLHVTVGSDGLLVAPAVPIGPSVVVTVTRA